MPAEKRRDTKTKNPHGKACPGNNQYRSVSSFLLVVLPREKRVGIRSFLQAGTVKKTISVHIRTARFAPFFCRADVRQSSDRRERKSHAERRVRQDAKASCPGLGETPTSSAVISKRISRCTACIRFRNVSFLECLRTGKIFCFWAVSY